MPGLDAAPSTSSAPDPFDPASLRIDPAVDAELGVKKPIIHVPVRRPGRQEYFRTHPGEQYRMTIAILELKEEREFYAVVPAVAKALPGETRTTGAAFRRVHPSHHCWQIFTCAGLCWGGRSSALNKVSALASSPMRTIS